MTRPKQMQKTLTLIAAAISLAACATTSGTKANSQHITSRKALSAATCLVSTQYIARTKKDASLKASISQQKKAFKKIEPDRNKRKETLLIVEQSFSERALKKLSTSHEAFGKISLQDLGVVQAHLGRRECAKTASLAGLKN